MSYYVDLDGTLAKYGDWKAGYIGEPIEPMMQRVRNWIEMGETVKIFTARAGDPDEVKAVKTWLKENGLPDLEVTNIKGFDGLEFWDDRAVTIQFNTGKILGKPERKV